VPVAIGVLIAGPSPASLASLLILVIDVLAVVEGVDDSVEVDVVEVADVADLVAVRVLLVGVGDGGAVVAGVPRPVAIAVRLRRRVVVEWAVVDREGDAVAVQVVEVVLTDGAVAAGV